MLFRSSMQPRKSARESAERLLKNFINPSDQNLKKSYINPLDSWFSNEDNIRDALAMIERELGGYLSNPGSIFSNIFNQARKTFFSSGLGFRGNSGIGPNRDLLLVLDEISKSESSFKNLDHPEIGIYKILGYDSSMAFFIMRLELLNELYLYEQYNRKIILIIQTIKLISRNYKRDALSKVITKKQSEKIINLQILYALDEETEYKKTVLTTLLDHKSSRPYTEISTERQEAFNFLNEIELILNNHFEDEYLNAKTTLATYVTDSWHANITANLNAIHNIITQAINDLLTELSDYIKFNNKILVICETIKKVNNRSKTNDLQKIFNHDQQSKILGLQIALASEEDPNNVLFTILERKSPLHQDPKVARKDFYNFLNKVESTLKNKYKDEYDLTVNEQNSKPKEAQPIQQELIKLNQKIRENSKINTKEIYKICQTLENILKNNTEDAPSWIKYIISTEQMMQELIKPFFRNRSYSILQESLHLFIKKQTGASTVSQEPIYDRRTASPS